MPGFPCPGRPGGELDEPLLDMIFGGRAVPPDAPQEMHDLARTLAALAGPAEPGELAGEAAALAAFRFASPAGISSATPLTARLGSRRPSRHVSRRRAGRGSRRPAWGRAAVAAAAVIAVAALGSAAAYSGVLPGPFQGIAHEAVGAPAPHYEVPSLSAVSNPRRDTGHGLGAVGRPAAGPTHSTGTQSVPKQPHETLPPAFRGCPGPWQYQAPGPAPPWHPSWPPRRLRHCPKPLPLGPPDRPRIEQP